METPLRLLLDLGDVLTKGLALLPTGGTKRIRFPSVVARRLLEGEGEGEGETSQLLLRDDELPRPVGFDPRRYPRTRSYPGAASLLEQAEPAPNPRFAGWLATRCGADRQLLGLHPTAANVDALVRKALLSVPTRGCRTAEVLLVVDLGAKSRTLLRYAGGSPRTVRMRAFKPGRARPREVVLETRRHVLDAASCAAAALPGALDPAVTGRVLWLDVGYLRTKLAVIAPEGCVEQRLLDGLGVVDCVRRILRDGQEQELVEDELAVMRALERSQATIEIAGRRFDVQRMLGSARRSLVEELVGDARSAIVELYARDAEPCRAVAVTGGGAALVGDATAQGLVEADVGVTESWVASDPSFFLLEGARRLQEAS